MEKPDKTKEVQSLPRSLKVSNFDPLNISFPARIISISYSPFPCRYTIPGNRPGHSSVFLAECSLLSLVPRKATGKGGTSESGKGAAFAGAAV